MKDPIEEKYHKQAEETRKELEEEGRTDEKFGCLFFSVLILGIITWFVVGPTKIKIGVIVTIVVGLVIVHYLILPKLTNILEQVGDFFEKLFKK